MSLNGLTKEVDEMAQTIAKELGYKGYDDEWGREHLIDGNHGSCFFSDTTGTLFLKLVKARLKIKELEERLAQKKPTGHHRISHDGPCEEGCYYETYD